MRAPRSSRGASAVEYGLLVSGIAAIIAAAVYAFGGVVHAQTESSCSTVVSQMKHGADDTGCAPGSP